ncbi:MAG TPA: SDR family NAD(P)-dependent oxidoreductase [Candidatus Goldiibacteriota bacterium]|nr:SDR family NAD(P)-dependent oxidoreductase [Candidatus Goldiibacteriota bacterium]
MNILITGGAGFIGSNVAERFLKKGCNVTVFDNLSRRGTSWNLDWLRRNYRKMKFIKGDIRKYNDLLSAFRKNRYDAVFHFAAQVAVTTSVTNPREDFEINALGTFNLLEAVRNTGQSPVILYSSTNKVYGGMTDIKITERDGKYCYESIPGGIDETRLLDFHSPYGCSKGTADQYMIDYARIYGLKTVVFRQSCIYGYRQFGIEDQGWVAWFTIAAMLEKPLTIYGDGKQVRDVLFIEDLADAYEAAIDNIEKCGGQAFNVGGGPNNTMSLLELIAFLEKFFGRKIPLKFADWRPGDQPVFICDITKAGKVFGWQPKTSPEEGVKLLYEWVKGHKRLFEDL